VPVFQSPLCIAICPQVVAAIATIIVTTVKTLFNCQNSVYLITETYRSVPRCRGIGDQPGVIRDRIGYSMERATNWKTPSPGPGRRIDFDRQETAAVLDRMMEGETSGDVEIRVNCSRLEIRESSNTWATSAPVAP
jgi:hypothetical protein